MNWTYMIIVYPNDNPEKVEVFTDLEQAVIYLDCKNEELVEHDLFPNYELLLVPKIKF